MSLLSLSVAATLLFAHPASDRATLTVSFTVPLSCDVHIVGSEVADDRLILDVARRCNSRHQVAISSGGVAGLGPVSIVDEATGRVILGGEALLQRAEQFTTSTDRIVLMCPDATPSAMAELLSTISIGVIAV